MRHLSSLVCAMLLGLGPAGVWASDLTLEMVPMDMEDPNSEDPNDIIEDPEPEDLDMPVDEPGVEPDPD
jgi:hypothetical protein